MTEVVVNMVAMILENIVVFILAFPTGTTTSNNLWCILHLNVKAGYPLIAIEAFPRLFVDNAKITPVNQQSIIAST